MSEEQPSAQQAEHRQRIEGAARNHFRSAFTIFIIATVVLEAIFILVWPHLVDIGTLPAIASDRSEEINQVLFLFTVLSIPVFALVVTFVGYSSFAFGSRVKPRVEGPAVMVNPRFQFWWVAVSFVLVTFLFVYGLFFLSAVNAQPASDALHVNVTGEQWLWNYSYPQYNNISGTTLMLPVNRSVVFTITSIDVQHSFWIPAFGIKQDAVPGETTSINVTPNKMGTYEVHCAELCGVYHAYMATPVQVVSALAFSNWTAQQERPQVSQAAPPGSVPSLIMRQTDGDVTR